MSKQVYIDENGNEIQVSGTVNTADMMPMSASDSTKVKTAIGSLSTLTTTDKSSLVGAVNSIAPTIYTPTTTTATITVTDTWSACLVVVTRRWIPYNATFIFMGANSVSESQIIELYKGSNITLAKTDGNKVTITSDQLATSEISVTPLIGSFTISG